ncbi:MAG: MFS transporter [Planctomycetota bacterium]
MKRSGALVVIFLINIVMEITFVTGYVAGETLTRLFGISARELGLFWAISNVGWLVSSPLAGWFSHRFGPFGVLVVGLLAGLPAVGVVACAHGYAALLVGSVAMGVTLAFASNANATLLAAFYPEKLRRVTSLAAALWFTGSGLAAAAIGSWLVVAERRGWTAWAWRAPYFIDILLLAACAFAGWIMIGPAARKFALPAVAPTDSSPSRSREWLWIIPLAALHGIMVITLSNWTTKMAQEKFQIDERSAALVLSALLMGMAVGRLLLASVRLPVDERSLLAVSAFAGAACFSLGLILPDYKLTLVAMGVGGFFSCATYPCIIALIGHRFAHGKAWVFGFMGASVSLGGIIGPSLAGVLADRGLPLHRALVLSPLAAAALGALAAFWRLRDPPPPRP